MTRDCWKDFAASGRVSDYLKYREQEFNTQSRQQMLAAVAGGTGHGIKDYPDGHGVIRNVCR